MGGGGKYYSYQTENQKTMKKLIYSAAALSLAFFAASCQQENLEPVETGSNTVTYSVQVPGAIATKANPGSVAGVTELVYEVYRLDANGEIASLAYEDVVTLQDGKTKWDLELEFVKDQKFQVLFWAQKPNKGAYSTGDLREVTINKTLTANVDDYAAFAGHDFVTNCVSHKEGKVTLVRPISQIQVGTDAAGLVLGTEGCNKVNISLTSSSMLVKGLPTSYNVANGEVSETEQNVEYTVHAVPAGTFTANSKEYTYVAQNYVAFAASLGTTVEVDFTVTTTEGDIQHTVSNVPLKPNYRTNIIGNLITENADYSIDLEENWADDDKSMEVIVDGLVKNINGDYEVTEAKGLAYAINKLFEDGGNFYLTAPLYDLSGFAVTAPSVPAGVTLNIYGETPVVTRSSVIPTVAGVTIVGLEGALIDVIEGAVSVSGVTLKSDDQSKSTVLVNEVKESASVVISDCEADKIVTTGSDYVVNASEVKDLASLQASLASGVKEVVISTPLVITGDVTINLNGKTVKAVDQMTGSYGMITNKGTLVIDGEGTLQLSAENDRGWNAYSSVISNTVGGHLTVNKDVVIEHLGGTSMAYGIDNLTNGKGTSAITVINGATVKSTYRAIRQFLNGVEANNSLTVKAGSVVESTTGNKGGIWMQDPSANANSGSLVVEDGAKVSSIYLDVTAGSTAWPVEVSIAKSAVPSVISENLPDGYSVVDVNGVWTVQKPIDIDGYTYTINNLRGLQDFAVLVNSGNTFEGKTVVLGADIDLAGIEWTPIGSATQEHGFMGNFDGNGKTIKNLTMTTLTPDGDNYVYAGLFGVTEGTPNNENKIENLVIENVTIETTGHIAAAAIAYPYYTTVENITVKGNINIKGGDYIAGILAYTRRCVNAKDLTIVGNENSIIEGSRTVGGVISDIQTNGGLKANYSNFSASSLTIKGVRNVGGISGIISSQTLDGATVENVKIESEYTSVGIISGAKGDDNSFIKNETYNNVAGANSVIGDSYGKDLKKVSTADELVEALENNDGVYLMNDIKIDPAAMSNAYGKTGINIKNGQTIDGNGKTLNIKGAGGTWDSGINTTGGLIKNLTVTGSFRGIFINHTSDHSEKVVLENVTITGTVYTISCDQGLYQGIEATNCTFNGWTSFAKTAGETKFVNCTFGEGNGYKYCRPYSNTEFVGCTFCSGYIVDTTQAEVTFTDCIYQ